jgi:uncharacterized membrane protein (DUF4010 family)
MSGITSWFKAVLSESSGVPSSVRVCLFLLVAAVVGCVVYVIVEHTIHHTLMDIPKNLSDLLAFCVGALAAAKAGSKFGEKDIPAPPTIPNFQDSNTPSRSAKATDPNI